MQKPNQDTQKPTITKRKALQNLNAALGEQDQIIPSSLPPLPLLPAERSTRALKPSALKMAKLKPSAFLDSLKRELPVKLSSWIEGNKPKNIYLIQIASPGKDTGFNTISWQDDDGSKLYLQNLNSSGVIYERFKVTYPEVESLAKQSGWKNVLPDTIFVNLKSAGNDMSRMAAKKMVLGMLDDYGKSSKLPNKLILKEETKTDNPDHGESVITFSVKGITQIEPIMDTDSLLIPDQRLAVTLQTALSTYKKMLSAGVDNGFRVEEVAATKGGKGKQARDMFQAIKEAALSLQNTVNTEIENQKRTGLKKSDIAILSKLRDQVGSAIKDDFKNELDTRRWQQWGTFKPLTEDQIVPGTRTQIGSGAQGAVFKCQLDPVLGRSPVVLKYDSNGLNDEAKGAGIPELNPQQSVRAVAAFMMSKQLKLGIIPQTEFFVGTDADGRPKMGQAMEVVNGPVGQRKAGLKNDAFDDEKSQRIKQLEIDYVSNDANKQKLAQDELLQLTYFRDDKDGKYYPKPPIDQKKVQAEIQAAEDIVNNPASTALVIDNAQKTLDKYVEVNGEWYHAQNFPVNIAYGNPVVQQGLSDLQVFDNIIGHADRNPGNWIYEKDNTGSITGVKGIDNDDTFGEKWSPEDSKTPGIPPIVDISTALSILNADFNKDIRPLLAGLSNDEIDKAAARFDQVQQQVESRVLTGKIASIAPTGDAGVQAKLEALRNLTGAGLTQTLRWGNLGIADTHTEQNSYLGSQIAQKNQEGVVPESGVVLV